jgi:mRNA interferase RelE/StbE
MTWIIKFKPAAIKSLSKINSVDKAKIKEFLTVTLPEMDNPRSKGEALHGVLRDYWKYRIGNFRVIAYIEDKVVTITVVEIGHRREVYDYKPKK